MANTDESTQASLRLMDQIRNSRLFTMPTTGDEMKLTQRNTNLCVSIAAMRLICFAFIVFLEKNIKQNKRSKLESLCGDIIRFPKVQDSKKKENESTNQISGKFLRYLDRLKIDWRWRHSIFESDSKDPRRIIRLWDRIQKWNGLPSELPSI